MSYKFGSILSFVYGKKQRPGQVGGWKNDKSPLLLVFYDDGVRYIEGINTNYLSKWYIKRLRTLIRTFPGVDGEEFYNIVKKTAWYAVGKGYRKYMRASLRKPSVREKREFYGKLLTERKVSSMKRIDVNESFKAHYPSLKRITQLHYTDPRLSKDLKNNIKLERDGNFKKGKKLLKGAYLVYEDAGFYVGVHVSSELNEEDGKPYISVVALDKSYRTVKERVAYRMRRGKNLAETVKEGVEKNDTVPFSKLKVGDKFRYPDEGDDIVLVKSGPTTYKHDGLRYPIPKKTDLVVQI